MKKYFQILWYCKIWKDHKWTAKVHQYPKSITIENFIEYSTLYCERCGHISEKSKEFNKHLQSKGFKV